MLMLIIANNTNRKNTNNNPSCMEVRLKNQSDLIKKQ